MNDPSGPAHTVVAEGSTSNTWASVADMRSGCQRRDGALGVIHNGPWQVADFRLGHSARRGSFGVADPAGPSPTIIGADGVSHSGRSVADARSKRHAGKHGVMDAKGPAHTVIGQCRDGKGWAAVNDGRKFRPTHRVRSSAPLHASREQWTRARFVLEGPPIAEGIEAKGRPTHVIIQAPDGTIHRPLTALELGVLQGLPAWHRAGDPTEIAIGAEGGQWLDLAGGSDAAKRERIGNMVPAPTAQAIGEEVLEVLDAGAREVWQLSSSGIWVERAAEVHAEA